MTATGAATARVDSLRTVEHEVGVLLRRVRRVLGERARAVHPDLQAGGYLVLSQVVECGPVRSSTVGVDLNLDKGAISRTVQHLIELGLVVREPDPDDGRATLLSTSEEGLRRVRAVDVERRALLDERFSGWSDDDLGGLAETLVRYNATLA